MLKLLTLMSKFKCKLSFISQITFFCRPHLLIFLYWFQLRVVHGLLFALGNANHPDSQRQAALTLEVSFNDNKEKSYKYI